MTARTRHNIKNGFYLTLFLAAVMGFTFWFMTLAAQATGPNGEWHTWEVQGDYGPDWDQNYAEAFAQPQVHVGEGQLAPECGTWYQQDFYPYKAEKHGKSIDAVIADGLLHDGEDHHLTGHADGKWRFVYGGECSTPDPTPTPNLIVPVAGPFAEATCDTDGSYTLPAGPPAQNHDGATLWGVQLDGYDLYVRNTTGEFGGPGVYAWEAYGKKGTLDNDGSGRYPSKDFSEHLYFTVPAATGDCVEPEPTPEVTPTPEPEPSPEPTPACGPIGSCGTVPEKAEDAIEPSPEPTFAASSTGPIYATDDTPLDSTPVLATTGADPSTPLMIAAALGLVGAGVAIVRKRAVR